MTTDRTILPLKFEHDESEDGWCSLCKASALRGVRIQHESVLGGVVQADPSFDETAEDKKRSALDFHYRIGTCCIGRMVNAMEQK